MKKIPLFLTVFVLMLFVSSCGLFGNNKKSQDVTTKTNIDTVKIKPTLITKEDFNSKISNLNSVEWEYLGDKPVIVDFYADWCGPCRSIAPILEELANEYSGRVDIYKVDTDVEVELAQSFGITSIPSLMFIPMEGEPTMLRGALSKSEFVKKIDELLLK